MTSIIEELIKDRAAKEEAARAAKAEEKKKLVSERLEALKKHLGEFWTILEKRAEETGTKIEYSISYDGGVPEISIDLPASEEYSLAPILIHWGRHALSGSGYYDYNQIFKVWGGAYYRDLASALKAARDAYPQYKESERKKRIDWYNQETRYYTNPRKTEEEMRALIDQLKTEFPEKAEQGEKILAEWLRLRNEETASKEAARREKEEYEAKQALEKTLLIKYILELAEWLRERDAIQFTNNAAAEAIQKDEDDFEYTVYKLTYAIVATDTEGDSENYPEHYIETRSVYVRSDQPDESGFWIVNGKPVKYYHLVSLEGMIVSPSSGIFSRDFERGGVKIRFAPNTPDALIEIRAREIEDLPKEPEHPDELGYLDDYTKRTYYIPRARALLNGKTEEEEIEGDF